MQIVIQGCYPIIQLTLNVPTFTENTKLYAVGNGARANKLRNIRCFTLLLNIVLVVLSCLKFNKADSLDQQLCIMIVYVCIS